MAWPRLQKFLSGGVIMKVSWIPKQKDGKPQIQELEPPAVTFCARNTTYWENATLVVENDIVKSNCKKETNKQKVWLHEKLILHKLFIQMHMFTLFKLFSVRNPS